MSPGYILSVFLEALVLKNMANSGQKVCVGIRFKKSWRQICHFTKEDFSCETLKENRGKLLLHNDLVGL